MPSIPLPYVLALLLAVLLVRLLLAGDRDQRLVWHHPASLALTVCVALVLATGLHWSTGLWIDGQWPVALARQLLASALPPLVWISFCKLTIPAPGNLWRHGAGPVLVLLLAITGGPQLWLTDPVLGGLAIGYGLAILGKTTGSSDRLLSVRLESAGQTRLAARLAGAFLCGAGLVDILISLDFGLYQGSHAAAIVATSHMLLVPLVAITIAVIGRSTPVPETGAEPEIPPEVKIPDTKPDAITADSGDPDHDVRILEQIEQAMHERRLHHDPDLTLDRLARRIGIPTRQISGAVNRRLGRNVSQLVNDYRIADAMALLRSTDLPVTTVMLECGFQTKSNFNREFSRVTGTTPTRYRQQSGQKGFSAS